MTGLGCPNCSAPMARAEFLRRPQGIIELDICFPCHMIWFDQYESIQLAPGGVVELFRQIHEHHDEAPQPVAPSARCPRCRDPLKLTHDIQGSNKISYYRCLLGHGRLTTFFQFLREKQFVRSVTAAEVNQLKATVKQVRCSSCGAGIAVDKDAQCSYCRAPISILDAEAVSRTLKELAAKERTRESVAARADPHRAVSEVLAGHRYAAPRQVKPENPSLFLDLVTEAVDFLMN